MGNVHENITGYLRLQKLLYGTKVAVALVTKEDWTYRNS
jgi:hypothetical protein